MKGRIFLALVLAGTVWGETLDAITLETAFQRTLENNPTIQEAKVRLEQAAGRRVVLRAIAYPDA